MKTCCEKAGDAEMVKRYDKNYIWLKNSLHKKKSGQDNIEYFFVEWPSYWNDAIIRICVKVAQIKEKDKYYVVDIGVPRDIPKNDLKEIKQAKWYAAQIDEKKKYPSIKMVWGFKDPPILILACSRLAGEKSLPLEDQLEEMTTEEEPDPAKYSIINEIRRLGPGICTVISKFDRLDVRINKNGVFRISGQTSNHPPAPRDSALTYLVMLISSSPTLMLVRSFTDEPVSVKVGKRIVPTTIKEVRGFATKVTESLDGEGYISWYRLTPEETKEVYNDYEFGFKAREREYKFV